MLVRMPIQYSDIELKRGCLKGKADFQRALVMQYSEQLYATSFRYVKDEDDAKDIMQEAFISIFKSMHQYDPEKGRLISWMSKILVNLAIKHYHRSKEKVSYNEYFENASSDTALALHNLEASHLYDLITELDDPYGMVFNLSVVEGYSHKEIATKLNIQPSSSRSILTRAKAMLRDRITDLKKKKIWI